MAQAENAPPASAEKALADLAELLRNGNWPAAEALFRNLPSELRQRGEGLFAFFRGRPPGDTTSWWPRLQTLLLISAGLVIGLAAEPLLSLLQRPRAEVATLPFAPEPLGPMFLQRPYVYHTQTGSGQQTAIVQFGVFGAIHVMPAPQSAPAMNGSLRDWDRHGGFRSRLAEPYGDAYSVEAHMMADRDYLYLGAHVRDPAPLRNAVNSATAVHSEDVYMGGSVQVHFSTTPASPTGKANGAKSMSDPSLVHIHMWMANQEPKLHVYQLDSNEEANLIYPAKPEDDYKDGKFIRDPDRRGYTLTYRIPWTGLGKEMQMPVDGATHAVCWDVHWSDEKGQKFMAKLSEVIDGESVLKEDPVVFLSYRQPSMWGKAIFHTPLPLEGGD
jgi:hypothetical protein